jgi:O-antigen/teichoic acid export membrane protein
MTEPEKILGVPGPEPARPKAARNVFWLIAERAVKAVGGVGMGVIIARHLGPGHYGSYGAAIGLATLSKEGVMLGFDRMVRRDLSARPGEAGKIIGTSIALGLVLAVAIAFGLSAVAGRLVDDEETRRLTLIVVWMALPQAFYSCEVWFESSGQARPLVRVRNAVWIVAMVGRLILVLTGATVISFAVLALAEWVATYAAVCILLRNFQHRKFDLAVNGQQLRAWFREGWPMVLMVVVGSTADRVMVLVVHNLAATDAEAGYLNAALRVTEIWWSMSAIVGAVLLPRIVAMQLSDPGRCARATQLYANASLLVGTGAALAVTLTAPFVVPLLFGRAYAPSAMVMVILFWSGPAVYPAAARAQFWVSRGLLALDLPTVACIAILQISLAAFLVPSHGAIGAALSMVVAQWIGFYGLTLCVPSLRRASRTQLIAFKALLKPVSTGRSLYEFFAAMLRKS